MKRYLTLNSIRKAPIKLQRNAEKNTCPQSPRAIATGRRVGSPVRRKFTEGGNHIFPPEVDQPLAEILGGRKFFNSYMNHKEIVQQIANLDWAKAAPGDIILLSHCTAKEFASSLRFGVSLYPSDERLKEMADGELKTDNMSFEDYDKKGDHWEFLDHFITKYNITPSKTALPKAMSDYVSAVEGFSDSDRAMTVFSREEELTLIFEKIVAAHDWDALGLGFYKYYLKQHILFDSGDHGHAWLTKHFPMHQPTLAKFYTIRLNLYSVLF